MEKKIIEKKLSEGFQFTAVRGIFFLRNPDLSPSQFKPPSNTMTGRNNNTFGLLRNGWQLSSLGGFQEEERL
jgi:hypothetical protein